MSPSTQSPPSRHAWADVHLSHLVANARTVREAAGGAPLLPMVKADAYGLGAAAVVRALELLDPWGYGVATVEEGAALRAAGITRPVLVFTPAATAQRDEYARHDLRAVLDAPEAAARWELPFHLEIDTGMARCGVRWDDASRLAACAVRSLEGVFTHLYAADRDPASVDEQWDRFQRGLRCLPGDGRLVHAANSAGAWRLRERLDLVRPGIFLYGGRHGPDLPAPQPVMTLRAPVVSVRRVHAGDGVSYGHEWHAARPTTIATVAAGYADGVPRAVQGKASVLIGGRRFPVVGRVTMDFVMVDVGDAGVAPGAVATLIGNDGEEEITVDEFAGWGDTISYEILTGLGPRVPRRYAGA